MPVIIPPGFGEVTFHSTVNSGKAINTVYGVVLGSVPTQTELNTLSTAFGAPWTNILSTNSAYVGCRLLIGQDGGPPTILESVSGAGAGGRGSAMCPPQVQHLIRKGTNIASRQGIGRTFVPDVVEGNVTDTGVINSTEQTLCQTFATAVFAALLAGAFDGMCLLHSDSREPDVVESYVTETKVATLRRRFVR